MNGEPITDNVSIYAFDNDNQCVGSSTFSTGGGTTYFLLNVLGDDVNTDEDEGLSNGEEYFARLYDADGVEYQLDEVSFIYTNTNGTPDGSTYPFSTVYNFQSSPLPVILKYFYVDCSDGAILRWETTLEEAFSGFAIEYSAEGRIFSDIAWQSAKGANIPYTFVDEEQRTGYYRLRMVDVDFSYNYSPIDDCLGKDKAPEIILFPNPATDFIHFSLDDQTADMATVEIIDIGGRQLLTTTVTLPSGVIPVSSLPSGSYVMRTVIGRTVYSTRITKQ